MNKHKDQRQVPGRRIVTIGAGTGHRALLTALRPWSDDDTALTAVVGVTDNGGHSGELRIKHHMPAVGDARQCLVALARNTELAQHYEERDPQGRSFGNARLAVFFQETRNTAQALRRAAEELDCCGEVLPTTDAITDIRAFFEDGTAVTGEFDILEHSSQSRIAHMELDPPAQAHAAAIEAIRNATHIILPPGGLYNGILPALLPSGIKDAITESAARFIQIINLMTDRLTRGWNAEHFITELAAYAGRTPDAVIMNNGAIPQETLEHYKAYNAEPIAAPRQHNAPPQLYSENLIPETIEENDARTGNFKKSTHLLKHDPRKLRDVIARAI